MCRNIKRLRLPEGPAPRSEIDASALQYVRKVSGFRRPSRANAEVFAAAVREVADATERLLADLHSAAGRRRAG